MPKEVGRRASPESEMVGVDTDRATGSASPKP